LCVGWIERRGHLEIFTSNGDDEGGFVRHRHSSVRSANKLFQVITQFAVAAGLLLRSAEVKERLQLVALAEKVLRQVDVRW
jgi:hypothetical protein